MNGTASTKAVAGRQSAPSGIGPSKKPALDLRPSVSSPDSRVCVASSPSPYVTESQALKQSQARNALGLDGIKQRVASGDMNAAQALLDEDESDEEDDRLGAHTQAALKAIRSGIDTDADDFEDTHDQEQIANELIHGTHASPPAVPQKRAPAHKGLGTDRPDPKRQPEARPSGMTAYPDRGRKAQRRASPSSSKENSPPAPPLTAKDARNLLDGRRNPARRLRNQPTTPSDFGQSMSQDMQEEDQVPEEPGTPPEEEDADYEGETDYDAPLLDAADSFSTIKRPILEFLNQFLKKHRKLFIKQGLEPDFERVHDLFWRCSGNMDVMLARLQGRKIVGDEAWEAMHKGVSPHCGRSTSLPDAACHSFLHSTTTKFCGTGTRSRRLTSRNGGDGKQSINASTSFGVKAMQESSDTSYSTTDTCLCHLQASQTHPEQRPIQLLVQPLQPTHLRPHVTQALPLRYELLSRRILNAVGRRTVDDGWLGSRHRHRRRR